MRIGLGNVLTTEEHLRKGWEIVQETAAAVLEKPQNPKPHPNQIPASQIPKTTKRE
jgi:hypothetical protein